MRLGCPKANASCEMPKRHRLQGFYQKKVELSPGQFPPLYQFPIVAVTNCQTEQLHTIQYLQSRKSEVYISLTRLKASCQLGWFLPETLGENPLPCLFPLLEATFIPWQVDPPLSPKPAAQCLAPVITAPSSVIKCPSPSLRMDPYDYMESPAG